MQQSNYRSLITDNNSHLYDRFNGNAREIASRFIRDSGSGLHALIHIERGILKEKKKRNPFQITETRQRLPIYEFDSGYHLFFLFFPPTQEKAGENSSSRKCNVDTKERRAIDAGHIRELGKNRDRWPRGMRSARTFGDSWPEAGQSKKLDLIKSILIAAPPLAR